jgi:predicted O-methyltransferase YrrM
MDAEMLQVEDLIDQIYSERQVVGKGGLAHRLHSGIDRNEGELISSIIAADGSIRRTLEVGCAYGLSSLYICGALKERNGASHTMIDPFQFIDWDGAGIANLERCGIDYFTLIESRSEYVLPRLVEAGERFDLVLVDGFHTFDHTMIDCFDATRLPRTGGVLIIDDVAFSSVGRVVAFLRTYPCYKQIGDSKFKRSKPLKSAVAAALSIPIGRPTWARLFRPFIARYSRSIGRK